MIYSSACAHAIRALSQLALMSPEGNVLLDDLCERADLSRHFVAKIFQDLVRGGLLTSTKGRGGGFALSREPEEITLWDIMVIVDGASEIDQCVVGIARCDDTQPCPQHEHWKPIRSQLKQYLQQTDLAQMGRALERKLGDSKKSRECRRRVTSKKASPAKRKRTATKKKSAR